MRVLFIAEGQLGDLLLLTPAFRAVKQGFASSSLSVLTLERHTSVSSSSLDFSNIDATVAQRSSSALGTNPHVDELLVVSRKALRSTRGLSRLQSEVDIVRCLRRKEFDAVVCTFPEDRFALWALLSGAGVRIGQRKQGLSVLLTHKPDIEKSDKGVLEYYCGLVRELGLTVASRKPEYAISEESRSWAEDFLSQSGVENSDTLIAIHPGASGDYKIWPPERYAELIDRMQAKGGTKILLCRGPLDEAVAMAIVKLVRTKPLEVRLGSDVGRLGALLQRSALCISNDSGPRHLAIAVGTPSLALFRQHHDKEWGVYEPTPICVTLKGDAACPSCPPGACLDHNPSGERFGSYCMRMIDTSAVVAAAEDILRTTRTRSG